MPDRPTSTDVMDRARAAHPDDRVARLDAYREGMRLAGYMRSGIGHVIEDRPNPFAGGPAIVHLASESWAPSCDPNAGGAVSRMDKLVTCEACRPRSDEIPRGETTLVWSDSLAEVKPRHP